ncbi:MAG: hypothetical protein V4703_12815 [Actinomycetota bacterium]
MAWNDRQELRVASSGQVYIADIGVVLPEDLNPLDPADFIGLGLISEDGVTMSYTPTIEEFRSWQNRGVTRREVTAIDLTAAFALQQWNESTVPFAFGGGQISQPSPGIFRYDWPQGNEALNDKVMVIDAVDGDIMDRYVIPLGNVTESVETTLQRAALSMLPITFAAIETDEQAIAYWLTNDEAAFAAGS